MTKRAILLGILVSAVIGFVGFFNDMVMKQTMLFGSYVPIFLYGSLLVFVVAVNPLLRRLHSRAPLSAKELALILAIALPACFVSGNTLIHHFTNVLMTPRMLNKTNPGWQKRHLIRRIPPVMLAGVPAEYEPSDILDPEGVAERLEAADATPAVLALRKKLGASLEADAGQIARALNAVLPTPGLFADEESALFPLPAEALTIRETGPFHQDEILAFNRHCTDTILGDMVLSHQKKQDDAVVGFNNGIGDGVTPISISQIPWNAWRRTLARFWVPVILSLAFAFIGLALVFKRQWAEHEHIAFPIVRFGQSLLPQNDSSIASIFRTKAFWIPVAIVTFIHLNNYVQLWHPQSMVPIPTRFDFSPLANLFPVFKNGGGAGLLNASIFFTAVGFAYFVASDVSLSVGLAPYVYCIVSGILLLYGVNINTGGDYNSLRINNFIKSGSYAGMFIMIMYTGRHFYWSVLRRSLGMQAADEAMQHEIWGLRVAAFGLIAFGIQLVIAGVEWQWAVVQAVLAVMTYVVVSRIVAETGLFLIHPMILPVVLLWGFLGPRVIGPQQMLILMLVSAVLDFGCHVGVMPMMMHGLKLSGTKPARTSALAAAGLTLALFVAIGTALYFQHDRGASSTRGHWAVRLSQAPFVPLVDIENRLDAQGVLGEAGTGSFIKRLKHISPTKAAVIAFFIAMGCVIGTEILRLRIPKWPIHPVIFLISGFWHARVLAASFLLGWLIKFLVGKYGGSGAHAKLKPTMLGLIAGDMLAGILIAVFCGLYYLVTRESPPSYSVLPA